MAVSAKRRAGKAFPAGRGEEEEELIQGGGLRAGKTSPAAGGGGLRRGAFKLFLGLPIVVGGVGAGLVLGEGVRTGAAAEEEECGWWCLWASQVPESLL